MLQVDGTTGSFKRVAATVAAAGTPTDVVFGPDGQLYVTARPLTGGTGVFRFDAQSGALIDQFTFAPGPFNQGMFFIDERCADTQAPGGQSGCFAERAAASWTKRP